MDLSKASVFSSDTPWDWYRARRWRRLTRSQDPWGWSQTWFLGHTSVVFTRWGTRRKQRLEKGPFHWRTVFAFARRCGNAAPLFAGAWSSGHRESWSGQLGAPCQGLCFPPQVCFDQRQVILKLQQDLVLRRSQWRGLDRTAEGVKDETGDD